jgi:predicted PurR-regulated permease PerM
MTILPPDEPATAPPQAEQLPPKKEWRLAGMIFLGILALALLWASVLILRPFASAIAIAVVIVTLSFPIYRRLRAKFNGKSGWAAIVMLLGITFLIVVPALILSMLLVQQANLVAERMQSVDAQQMMRRIDLTSRLQWVKRFAPNFDPASVSPERLLLPAVQRIPGWVARHGGAVLGGLAGAVIGFFLALIAAYYFYVEGEWLLQQLAELSPLPDRYDHEFGTRFKDVVDATFRGQLLTALAQGFATGVGLAIAQVPGAGFWGAVAAILSLLPMVGAAVVWVPAVIFLYIAASIGDRPMWHAIFLTIWGVGPVSLIDNVVRPWAMRGKAQLPAIPLLFAVLGGLQAFGFIGLVLGPLVLALLVTIIDIYRKSFQEAPVVANE